MDDKSRNELAEAIECLAHFLRQHNESSWADELDQDANWIRQDDRFGFDRFLALFGGMGSLNDLAFHPMNRNCASGAEAELNERLRVLRQDAWEKAQEARRG